MTQTINIQQVELDRQQSFSQIYKKQSNSQISETFSQSNNMEDKPKVYQIRKNQSIIIFFVNLCIPILLSYITARIILGLTEAGENQIILIIVFIPLGLLFSLIACLQITNWKQTLKLYFLPDDLAPLVISGNIGFFTVMYFLANSMGYWPWNSIVYAVLYPVWTIYYCGTLRVMLIYQKWVKWKIIMYKLTSLFCGLIFFYVGIQYMNGKYKITNGYLPLFENILKNTMLLFVFGSCQLYFRLYKRLSMFDQTEQLDYKYQFSRQAYQKLLIKLINP